MNTVGGLQGNNPVRANTLVGPVQPGFGPSTLVFEETSLATKERKMDTPKTLEWQDCLCGHAHCKRSHPINLGTFYQGTGFEPHERDALNKAWALLVANERELVS